MAYYVPKDTFFKWLTNGHLNNLVKSGVVQDYLPLVDKKGSYTAQYEHVSHFS